jgi:hypothetical protein
MPEILPTVFSNYVELHTAQLGVLLGLFVGILYRDRPTLAYALLFFGVLSAFGNASHIGFMRYSGVATEIEAKPWYFLSALYFSTVTNLLLLKYGTPLWRRLPSLPKPRTEDVVNADDRS